MLYEVIVVPSLRLLPPKPKTLLGLELLIRVLISLQKEHGSSYIVILNIIAFFFFFVFGKIEVNNYRRYIGINPPEEGK